MTEKTDPRNRRPSSQDQAGSRRYCATPPQPPRALEAGISAPRASAILSLGAKWVNQTRLHYYMWDQGILGGDDRERAVVREAFKVWKDVGIGLEFEEVASRADAEIRIGFLRGDGAWSVIGTTALSVGQSERTMNFGWNIDVEGPNGLDTAVHEIGHALGLRHEHQNPNAGIVWNRDAVYDYFAQTQEPPWDRDTTDHNILDKIPVHVVEGSAWDPDSIMHYAFESGLILQPEEYRGGLEPAPGLSDLDREVVLRFYPPADPSSEPDLQPLESQLLSLGPGEQRDFKVRPDASRDYEFSTFGASDTVMVLFEENDGQFRYLEGDDDSGFDRNARFRVRLIKGHEYRLRIRLYYSSAVGDTAVMMW